MKESPVDNQLVIRIIPIMVGCVLGVISGWLMRKNNLSTMIFILFGEMLGVTAVALSYKVVHSADLVLFIVELLVFHALAFLLAHFFFHRAYL